MRQIYIINATQIVTSESHPEGLYSVMSGYPKTYDSRTYPAADENPNGDSEKAFRKAEVEYLSRVSAILDADNPALQLVYDSMNQGQRKKLIKNEEVKRLLKFYGVIEEGEN